MLEDVENRNRELQDEVKVLREEITKLRASLSAPVSRKVGGVTRKQAVRIEGEIVTKEIVDHAASTGIVATTDTTAAPVFYENGPYICVVSRRGDRIAMHNRRTGQTKTVEIPVQAGASLDVKVIWAGGFASLLALEIRGPKVSRIAVYSGGFIAGRGRAEAGGEGWHSQELREPVVKADPIVNATSVAYKLGRYVYAFSVNAARWDVLELPPGTEPKLEFPVAYPGMGGGQGMAGGGGQGMGGGGGFAGGMGGGQGFAGGMGGGGNRGGGPGARWTGGLGDAFTVKHGSHIYAFNLITGKWKDLDLNAILDGTQREPEKESEVEPPPATNLQ